MQPSSGYCLCFAFSLYHSVCASTLPPASTHAESVTALPLSLLFLLHSLVSDTLGPLWTLFLQGGGKPGWSIWHCRWVFIMLATFWRTRVLTTTQPAKPMIELLLVNHHSLYFCSCFQIFRWMWRANVWETPPVKNCLPNTIKPLYLISQHMYTLDHRFSTGRVSLFA